MSYLREHDEHNQREGGWAADVIMISSFLGTVQVESCDRCPYVIVQCMHEVNTWDEPLRRILTCNLCGTDVT